ncbi:MAG: hypothetical protein KJP21_02840 [Bacteroidia bacterium]|nr:hypothetical protein [Bacteroidia bacterium]NNJ55760.1 hypothetical protein [Bacteroidia bacterium]
MKRVITSFKNANHDLLNAISHDYPRGVGEDELVNFPKLGGGTIRAIEVVVGDCLYLVKLEDQSYYERFLAKDENETDEELDIPDSDENLEDISNDVEDVN